MRYHVQVDNRHLQVELISDPAGGPPRVIVDGQELQADLASLDGPLASLVVDGKSQLVSVEVEALDGASSNGQLVVRDALGPLHVVVESEREHAARQLVGSASQGKPRGSIVRSQMPGVVIDVKVSAGDQVEAGQTLLVLEAMKMENDIRAEAAGEVKAVRVSPGQAVKKGEVLVETAACPQ